MTIVALLIRSLYAKRMSAKIIDGKALAASIRQELSSEVSGMKTQPNLAVVIVGDDPASHVYVRFKEKAAAECGIKSTTDRLPADTSEAELIAKVEALNADDSVHGILVQLPVPEHIDTNKIINMILPEKDVDGFHVVNAGKLATGQDSLVACTPQGCLIMLQREHESLKGMHAVVIGKSNIVGRPMAQLLLNEGCTVTVCHSKTKDVAEECRRADIIVAAVGRPHMVKAEWIKAGATIIDVGINRLEDGSLVGDVDYDAAAKVAGAITPVPGGVGPMTIACLLSNTVKAAKRS